MLVSLRPIQELSISYLISRSKVIEYLKEQEDTVTAYHYCDFVDISSTSPDVILRRIFVQLLPSTSDWMEDFPDLVSRKKRREPPPAGLRNLFELIGKIFKYHERVVIAVDALDECNESQGREEVLKHLRDLAQIRGVSVFLTSRKERDIDAVFQGLPSMSLTNLKTKIAADMKAYIYDQLQLRSNLSTLPLKLKEEIQSNFVKKADGM